jgi:hypothetical protein
VLPTGVPVATAHDHAPALETFAANPALIPPAFVRVVDPNVTFAESKFPVMIAPPSDVTDTPVGVTFPVVGVPVATAHDHAPALETFAANPVKEAALARVVAPNDTFAVLKYPVMIAPPSDVADTTCGFAHPVVGVPVATAQDQAPADDTFAANPVLVPPAFVRVVAPNVTFAVWKYPVMIAPPSAVTDTPVGLTFPVVGVPVATAQDQAPAAVTFAANPVDQPPACTRVVAPNVAFASLKVPVMIAPPSLVAETPIGLTVA